MTNHSPYSPECDNNSDSSVANAKFYRHDDNIFRVTTIHADKDCSGGRIELYHDTKEMRLNFVIVDLCKIENARHMADLINFACDIAEREWATPDTVKSEAQS